ncbi:uncharacterized protein [Ptychodera flava]|uniref:uncharacterized protein n=1 Tax=Ptychodera flava TaxID=63121 RepID=UPI003969CBF0
MNILPSLLLLTGLQSSLAQACRVLPETYGEWGSFQSYNGFVLEEEHSIGNFKLFSAADCAILCFTENRDTCRSLSYNRWTSHCIIYDGTPLVSSIVELHGYHLLYVDTTELTKNSASIPRLPVLDDSCGSNPCQNGGTCITDCNADNFICHCGIDWTGTYCDVANVVDTAYSCGDTATDLSGTVESPNYPGPYPTDLDCEITIRCSAGQSLWLTLTILALEMTLAPVVSQIVC